MGLSTRPRVSVSSSTVLGIRISNRMSEGPAGLLTRPIETASPPPYCAAFLSYVCFPVGLAKGRGTHHRQRPVYILFSAARHREEGCPEKAGRVFSSLHFEVAGHPLQGVEPNKQQCATELEHPHP